MVSLDLKHCHDQLEAHKAIDQLSNKERAKLLESLIIVQQHIGLTMYAEMIKTILKEYVNA